MFQNLFHEASQSINLIIAVDNISIDYNSTGQIEIKDGGVSTAKIANLAVTNAKISDMDASKLTGTITIPINNVSIETDRIFVSDQNQNTPSITFKNDQDTGIFRYGNNTMGFSAGAGHIMTIYPNRVSINFSGLTVYDEVTVNGDFEIFLGIMKLAVVV